ncbi:MAG: heme oxygenase [Myxococcales bacterium]|nr:MAG: heme oxygenase [Myxococcales bacterium]
MHAHPPGSLLRESEPFVRSLDDSPVVGKVINGNADEQEYVRFLTASYHYVRWSGFLLAQTAVGLRRSGRCRHLLSALDVKAAEEGPHDRWLLRDLARCRVNPELVKGAPVPSAVRAYVSFGLALAEAGSPGFLGAAYVLELISAMRAQAAARNLRGRGKIENIAQALSFLEGHGEADPGHVQELDRMLESIEDPQDLSDIHLSASAMRRLYPRFFVVAPPAEASCFV